jgi:ubiquinone/menaquinone biosynthesis C-methylase UbiE
VSDRGRAGTYDRRFVAVLYDLDVRLTSRPIWGASVASQARLLSEVLETGPVLDVPAGTGLITAKAVASRERAALVVAVDLSRAVLLRARGRLGSRAVYVEADVSRLPFRAGAFAAAHSANGFHLFPDVSSAAQELERVCRPRGRVVVTTWTDRGHVVARFYQRLLARLGHVERPRAPETYVAVLEAEGLVTQAIKVTGTLLCWSGRARP